MMRKGAAPFRGAAPLLSVLSGGYLTTVSLEIAELSPTVARTK